MIKYRPGNPGVRGTAGGKLPKKPPSKLAPGFFQYKAKAQEAAKPTQQVAFKNGAYYLRPRGEVKRPNGATGSGSLIESPAQIEERIKRMADKQYADQKKLYDEDAAAMRLQAEGRQKGLQAAYEAAARANADMGAGVQAGWNTAGQNIGGLAQTSTGSIRDALMADLASTEEALSRVGANGTGFDATSQAGVEQYRGGVIPGEFNIRMGGIGNQFEGQSGQALNTYGVQTGAATFGRENAEIDADVSKRLRELTAGRSEYENDLRSQFAKSQADQQDALFKTQELLAEVRRDQAKLKQQWQIALMSAKNKAETNKINAIYKAGSLENTTRANEIRAFAAESGRISANASAQNAATTAAGGGKNKPLNPGTKSAAITRADTAGRLVVTTITDNLWKKMMAKYDNEKDAQREYKNAKPKYFGTALNRVQKAIYRHLKTVGFTHDQIRRAAFDIVALEIEPPSTYSAWVQASGYPDPRPRKK